MMRLNAVSRECFGRPTPLNITQYLWLLQILFWIQCQRMPYADMYLKCVLEVFFTFISVRDKESDSINQYLTETDIVPRGTAIISCFHSHSLGQRAAVLVAHNFIVRGGCDVLLFLTFCAFQLKCLENDLRNRRSQAGEKWSNLEFNFSQILPACAAAGNCVTLTQQASKSSDCQNVFACVAFVMSGRQKNNAINGKIQCLKLFFSTGNVLCSAVLKC